METEGHRAVVVWIRWLEVQRLKGFTFLAVMRKTERLGCNILIIGTTTVNGGMFWGMRDCPAFGKSDWWCSHCPGHLHRSFPWSATPLSPFLPSLSQFRHFMSGSKYCNFFQKAFPECLCSSMHVYFFSGSPLHNTDTAIVLGLVCILNCIQNTKQLSARQCNLYVTIS